MGSPANPGSSVIHLCMSVNRTVNGSTSGCLSVKPMAMSSRLSQSKVGMAISVVQFLGIILVPLGYLDDDVRRPVRHRLATQSRLRCDPRSFVQLIQFRVRGFVARLQP